MRRHAFLVVITAWRGTEPLGAGDLAVDVAARWHAGGLVLALRVTDDVHHNDFADPELWQGDSVQLAFDVAQHGGEGYDAIDDHELNVALSRGASRAHRHHGPAGASNDVVAAVRRSGATTTYEIEIAAAAVPAATLGAGSVIGFSFLVNDNDGAGRIGWIEWTAGIGRSKTPAWFGELHLLAATSRPSIADGGITGGDAGSADAGHGLDTGTPDAQGPRPDAVSPTDAARAADARAPDAATIDGGLRADGSVAGGDDTDEACTCASTGSPSDRSPGVAALLVLALGLLRRRRSTR